MKYAARRIEILVALNKYLLVEYWYHEISFKNLKLNFSLLFFGILY